MSTPPMRLKFGSPPPSRPKSRPAAETPSAETPARTQRTLPGRESVAPQTGRASNPAVKEMQAAILKFSKALASTPIGSMAPAGAQTHQRGDQEEYLGGTDPFGEFLTSHYVNKKPSGGQQYVNVDMKSPARTETATPNKSFKGIVSTIARIGTPGSEGKPDGIWMERTNNALHQVADVGAALFNFAADLDIPIGGYSKKDVDGFKASIPRSYLDVKGREEEFAKSFTPHINALTNLIGEFKHFVLQNKQYSDYITQEKSFGKYDDKSTLTPDEQKVLQSNMKASIPGVNIEVPGIDGQKGYSVPVALQNVSSIDEFKKLLRSLKVNADDPQVLNSYIASIKGQLAQSTEGPGY